MEGEMRGRGGTYVYDKGHEEEHECELEVEWRWGIGDFHFVVQSWYKGGRESGRSGSGSRRRREISDIVEMRTFDPLGCVESEGEKTHGGDRERGVDEHDETCLR